MATQNPATHMPYRTNKTAVAGPGVMAIITALKKYEGTALFPNMMLWSLGAHILTAVAIGLVVFALIFFGFVIPLFDTQTMPEKDMEFTLVDTPANVKAPLKPKFKANQNSRAGGAKVAKQLQAQAMRVAGAPSVNKQSAAAKSQSAPQPARKSSPAPGPKQPQRPVKQVAKQVPTPQRQQPVERPKPKRQIVQRQPQAPVKVSQVKPSQAPAPRQPQRTQTPNQPPQPRVPVPPSRVPQVAEAPSLQAPRIRLPGAPRPAAPRAIATGPVVPSFSHGGGSGSQSQQDNGSSSGGGHVGPSQLPGAVSGGGGQGRRGHAGGGGSQGVGPHGTGGQGGRGSHEQFGSPGGGGGRNGVDAIAAPDYGAYMAELVVSFNIGRSGRLMGVSVVRSSGHPEADQAAIRAVQMSAPFRGLPAGHPDNDLAIQFTFDYNVYRGAGGFSYH
jgi:TonB family protein